MENIRAIAAIGHQAEEIGRRINDVATEKLASIKRDAATPSGAREAERDLYAQLLLDSLEQLQSVTLTLTSLIVPAPVEDEPEGEEVEPEAVPRVMTMEDIEKSMAEGEEEDK